MGSRDSTVRYLQTELAKKNGVLYGVQEELAQAKLERDQKEQSFNVIQEQNRALKKILRKRGIKFPDIDPLTGKQRRSRKERQKETAGVKYLKNEMDKFNSRVLKMNDLRFRQNLIDVEQ